MKNLEKYQTMSPFELKNALIGMAEKSGKGKMLNAGRGNPNFLNTTARDAFCQLGLFASALAKNKKSKTVNSNNLGFRPDKKGIAKKLLTFLEGKKGSEFIFLKNAIKHAEAKLKLNLDDFVFELADAVLGDFYPSPPRIFPNTEKVVNRYLGEVLCPGNKKLHGKFDLFATEGATAAMIYIFNSLKENKLLRTGDHIAIITPIFSPYLEIPTLNDYRLVQIHVRQNEKNDWQIPDLEIAKLNNKKIKALFMVHPANPASVKMNNATLKKIANLVKTKRKDLIILTDTVYATFVDNFHSLVGLVPENIICVYSFSKFFGVTGWRLGVIMLHGKNIIDAKIKKLGKKEASALYKRYKIDSSQPEKIKFIDRLVMDSRDVALAHTGGLSCPQQCIMCLFSLFYLLDKKLAYKKTVQEILKKRINNLYSGLGLKLKSSPEHTYYYDLVDVAEMARKKYGNKFTDYLTKKHTMIEFLFSLAREKSTVCLPGGGFAAPEWSLRVSLANLDDSVYLEVGKNISSVLQKYFREWKN